MIDEIQGYHPEKVRTKTKKIDHRLLQIFVVANREGFLLLEAVRRLQHLGSVRSTK